MPRQYKRKTDRAKTSEEQLNSAAKLVTNGNLSIRKASEVCGINRMTLKRFMDKPQRGYSITSAAHRVFTDEDEASLASHIKMLDNCFHGLNRDKCRILALDYANANDINTPANWNRDGMAGEYFMSISLCSYF